MTEMKYQTKPLDIWNEGKALRQQYYDNYAKAHERGGIRWAGGAWAYSAVPAGLGDDVWSLTGEPYGASVAFNKEFAARCQEAIEAKGFARDLCAYLRNYLGSVVLDEYVFGGKFPKPDFMWTTHICCSHAKWYQIASDLEGGVPFYCIDVSTGLFQDFNERRREYVVNQLLDGIDWLEKTTGRDYDDEKLIQAVYNECEATSIWAEICTLNKTIPAPLDEKTMYSLYVFGTIMKHRPEIVAFYRKLRDEVQDRVDNKIAAVGNEKRRVITDTQPPWGFLEVFRYLESYGVVSVGSLYTFALIGAWEVKDDGTWGPRTTPQEQGIDITTRKQALEVLADWTHSRPEWQHFYSAHKKSDMMLRIVREWNVDGVMLHYNRGCEGLSLNIAENRLAFKEAGVPVLPFEGNMGDEREFDLERTKKAVDSFLELLGVK